ncbi:MAG: MFS transporter [Mesorhizobium sp.]|nr:MAG: MFS transporter [Mesorhizobium sp.]TIO61523.1 MAG: MFS transporter [Mesorhizobium sp.]TJV65909.1 MAG: MFS transporter [Mesorhizobium sp.]
MGALDSSWWRIALTSMTEREMAELVVLKTGGSEKASNNTQLYIVMLAVAVVASNSLILSPILSDVATSLGSTPTAISRAVAAYGAGTMISALFLAPQIDRLGASRALRFALLSLALALLCSAGATNPLMLMGAQAFAGLSAGVILPSSYALATLFGEPKELSRSLGKVLFGWSLAFVCGIPGLALISDLLAWHSAYLILFAIALFLSFEVRNASNLEYGAAKKSVKPSLLTALTQNNVPVLLIVCFYFTSAFYGVFCFSCRSGPTGPRQPLQAQPALSFLRSVSVLQRERRPPGWSTRSARAGFCRLRYSSMPLSMD